MCDQELLDRAERAARRVALPEDRFDDLLRRRDRKRRNQRITAAAVGFAVFGAAIWVVTTGTPLDRSETAIAPGGAGTGPTATPTVAPEAEWDGYSAGGALHGSIPPEGVALSSPAVSELIAHYSKFRTGFVLVYADGRVILFPWGGSSVYERGRVYERRITREGVDLVRSGAVELSAFLGDASQAELPVGIWADPEVKLYAPPKYAICFSRSDGDHQRDVDPSQVVDLLPGPAQALLRAKVPRSYEALGNPPTECLEVTTEEARALDEILSDADVWLIEPGTWRVPLEGGGHVAIDFLPLFPDRVWHVLPG
jgi:hypothetical protein